MIYMLVLRSQTVNRTLSVIQMLVLESDYKQKNKTFSLGMRIAQYERNTISDTYVGIRMTDLNSLLRMLQLWVLGS